VNAQALLAASGTTRPFARRIIAPVLLVVSLLLTLHDAAHFRVDLAIEAAARAGMAALAAIMLYAWPAQPRYERQRVLLLWGVIGFSFDVFWQVAYSGFFQTAAMVAKYAGVAAGLGCFLALTISFANGERHRAARQFAVNVLAPAACIAVFTVGVVHGVLWIRDCAGTVGGCYVNDQLSFAVYRAYFALDSAARIGIFAAAAAAVAWSSENGQRLLLAAISAALLAAGTAIDFLARLHPLPGGWVFGLQVFDAACTLLFVIGLFIAIGKDSMFDVAFAFSSTVVSAVTFVFLLVVIAAVEQYVGWGPVAAVMLVWFVVSYVFWLCPSGVTATALRQACLYAGAMLLFYGIIIGIEATYHWRARDPLTNALLQAFPHAPVPRDLLGDLGLAAVGVFTITRFEDWLKELIAARLIPEEEKPLALVRHFRQGIAFFTEAVELERMLVHIVTSNLRAEFAHLFLHRDPKCYEADASYPDSLQKPPDVPVDELPPDVQCGKCRREELPSACVPKATFVPAMYAPKPGHLFGFLAMGPKRSEHGEDYTHRERKEMFELGKEAAAALYELRGRA
jgi:hypothetical protein